MTTSCLLLYITIVATTLVVQCLAAGGISGESLVQVRGKGSVLMKHLHVGDYVLVDDDKMFEPIQSISHHDDDDETEMIQILTAKTRLEVTPDHMVLLEHGAVTASSLHLGDIILDNNKIKALKTVLRDDGYYAPVTPSGVMMVNGCRIQSKSTTTAEESWLDLTLNHFHLEACKPAAQWFTNQSWPLQLLLFIPLLLGLTIYGIAQLLSQHAVRVAYISLLFAALQFSFVVKIA